MTFAQPIWLLGLLLIPLGIWAWMAQRQRAPRYAIRFTALPTLREAVATAGAGARFSWRPYLPLALLMASLAALGRPLDLTVIAPAGDHAAVAAAAPAGPTVLAPSPALPALPAGADSCVSAATTSPLGIRSRAPSAPPAPDST